LWSRLRGAYQSLTGGADGPTDEEELLPTFDTPEAAPAAAAGDIPVAAPVTDLPADVIPEAVPVAAPVPAAEAPQLCSVCRSPRVGDALYCFDCGFMFPERPAAAAEAPAAAAVVPAALGQRVGGRYELGELISTRGPITRYRGLDHGAGGVPVPVVIVRMPYVPEPEPPPADTPPAEAASLPPFEVESDVQIGAPAGDGGPATSSFTDGPAGVLAEWPGLGWERQLLEKVNHPSLPRVLDSFAEDGHYYLVEEGFTGRPLWDVVEDAALSSVERFGYLAELAEGLKALHDAGAILEGLRPDIVVVTEQGHAALADLSDLLPLPVPAHAPIRADFYTAPELVLASDKVDARADLYSFGAMLYALYLGRELTEMDFERQGVPKPFVLRFPDVHPALARIIMKTFTREVEHRFPSEEAAREDPTGFTELARALRTVGKLLGQVRLDIAGWTTTGKVRTNNEDAFALIHSAGSKQDDLGERALLLLADGMGGYEAGEVAAAMAIDSLRQQLLKEPAFAGLTGDAATTAPDLDTQALRELFVHCLRETNKQIFQASRTPGVGKRGMGCTAEVVYVDGCRVVVGHVGDSRTYHYSGGRLVQLTRDQTLVNRLIELGQLTAEEAENHPRKNELQQALGGQPVVDPLTSEAALRPGDWVIVCSDGLTGHVDHPTLTEMIQRADSAEMCARRLVNLANLYGGSDNCTVIAVRAT
jgi:protein phosphatase